ncbi:MAG: hypothetical protein Q4C54_01385 [Clostridia bacterium]|nr:hypothetical protein [Clostridia bacterium]
MASDYISTNTATDKPSIMSRALVPSSPIGPSKVRNAALGAIVGMLLMCGILTVRFLMDDKIKNADDIMRYTGLINLASIPVVDEKGEKRK